MKITMSGDVCCEEWCCMMRVMMRGSGWLARRAPNNPFSCWHSMDDTLSSADNLYTCHLCTDLLIILIICHCPYFWYFVYFSDHFFCFVTAHISDNLFFVTLSLPIFLIICYCLYLWSIPQKSANIDSNNMPYIHSGPGHLRSKKTSW